VVSSHVEILFIRFRFCAMVKNTPVNAVYRQMTSSDD